MDYISDAKTASEFRDEVVTYFKRRWDNSMSKIEYSTGKDKRISQTLAAEFKYQIEFWSNVKLSTDTK